MHNGAYTPGVSRHGLNIVTPLELSEWLMLTGKGIQNARSLQINPGSTVQGVLQPDGNVPYVLLDALQFGGVLTGQITYEFMAGKQRITAFAVDSFIQQELLLSEKGQGIRYTIISTQTSICVCNIDYLSIQAHVVDNEIRPALDFKLLGAR